MTPAPHLSIEYTHEFKRSVRKLSRKYRHIQSDIQPILDQLLQGKTPGNRIPGTRHHIYKVRVRNSDTAKGKSGGYRLIYYLVTENRIVLLTLYSKTEQGNISPKKILQIIQDNN